MAKSFDDAVGAANLGGTHLAKSPRYNAKAPIRIYTDLPQALPVLPAEIALVAHWWSSIVSGMVADNDNVIDADTNLTETDK